MNSVLNSFINEYRVVILVTFGVLLGIVSALLPCFAVVFLFLALWLFICRCEFLDSLFLFLVLGTFAFGRAFSILEIEVGEFQIFVTEFIFFAILAIIIFKGRVENVFLRFPRGVKFGMLVYLLLGTFYLIFGLFYNGVIAFRDVVLCIYPLFLLITVIVFNEEKKLKTMFYIIIPAIVLSLLNGLNVIIAEGDFILHGAKGFNFSLYYGLILIFGLSYLSYLKRYRFVLVLLVVLSMSLIIFLKVRAGWVAMIAGMAFLAIMMKADFIKYLKKYGLLFVFFIFLLIVTVNVFSPQILSGVNEKWHGLWHWDTSTESSANIVWRFNVWKQIMKKIIEKPLLGWGFGAQPGYYIPGWLSVNIKGIGSDSGIIPSHNHLLTITFKMGLFGLALFLFVNLKIFFYGLAYVKQCKLEFNRRFLIASLTGIVYWHTMALFFDIIESPPTSIFLWILLGLVLSVIYIDKQSIYS